ncbi:hypothetical protein Slin15195_G111850 [Septoria linicola]|uniref:Uncharacterized protein n=1 Tax=Septoria linicola TaxID=215465 RepID=A0A9Q9B7L3_9PEZI|nr:hypothetical protein Slin15195_G111850 [Septoria linicola]
MALPMADVNIAQILQTVPQDTIPGNVTAASSDDGSAASTIARKVVKTFDIHQPSRNADTKEVHCKGLQPFQILRKTLKPGRPMITISALPSAQIVAGTKSGRRECHIFVGNPELGATLWLPVVHRDGTWTFNAVDRALRWQETNPANIDETDAFELVDIITSEVLAQYHSNSGGVAIDLYCDMAQPLVLLVMASIMAILESNSAQHKYDGRKAF